MRTRDEIEREHRLLLTKTIADLERLATEHRATAGYLTGFSVGCEGTAKRLRDVLACSTPSDALTVGG